MVYISSYIAALLLFFLADMVWLGTMSSRLYKPTLGDILLTDVSMIPAIVFYLVYPAGLVVFAINPAFKSGGLMTAAALGKTKVEVRNTGGLSDPSDSIGS